MIMGRVPELVLLESIEQLEEAYRCSYGAHPTNISHWNPSRELASKMDRIIEVPGPIDLIHYSFSYELEDRVHLLNYLGCSPHTTACLITPAGSVSILCALNHLRMLGVSKLVALCPCYFTVPHCCAQLGLSFDPIYLGRVQGRFRLIEEPQLTGTEAIWTTNPIYSTSVYELEYFESLIGRWLSRGCYVVLDECLAVRGKELYPRLMFHPNLFSLIAPHKALNLNGLKFSALLFNHCYEESFDRWSDILYGCLSPMNVLALKHFLSPNYDTVRKQFVTLTSRTAQFLRAAIEEHAILELDAGSEGYFVTVYVNTEKGSCGSDISFLRDVIFSTGCSLIPGVRNHFGNSIPLCFRVNLARDNPEFRAALLRLFNYFTHRAVL